MALKLFKGLAESVMRSMTDASRRFLEPKRVE